MLQNPVLFGIIGASVTCLMLVSSFFGYKEFNLQLTSSCAVPAWILFATYTLLQYLTWRAQKRSRSLSEKEIASFGKALELATPFIMDSFQEKTKNVKEIARQVKADFGIPQDVTLRYIIALGQHIRQHGTSPQHIDPSEGSS